MIPPLAPLPPLDHDRWVLSVVIPCYNERDTILAVLERVLDAPVPRKEVIVVDDGSHDGTGELLMREVDGRLATVLRHDRNRGKGAALRTGFRQAAGDIVLVQDADFEYDPADYRHLLAPMLEENAPVVFGTRFPAGSDAGRPWQGRFWHRAGNRALTAFSNLLTRQALTDMETGYKAFRREVLATLALREDGFAIEPEITAKLARHGVPIREVPVSYRGRSYAEGKKIGPADAVRALWAVVQHSRAG